jgi:hypothetical protein
MKDEWLDFCLDCSEREADFYSGARKILRNVVWKIENPADDMVMSDAGYTKSKMTMLTRLYKHQESIDVAKQLWEKRQGQRKYGSVGFSCYNHLIKNDPSKKSKRASVMGPCIQSVVLTYLPQHEVAVDCLYRTTEVLKKFPADLVFLQQQLLSEFDFSCTPIREINFHFANVTVHPMYFVTILPHFDEPVAAIEDLKERDPYFHDWVVKWTARYLVPEYHRGIEKFAQAMRVHKDAHERIKAKDREDLCRYLKANHPGYRGDYQGDNEDE